MQLSLLLPTYTAAYKAVFICRAIYIFSYAVHVVDIALYIVVRTARYICMYVAAYTAVLKGF